MKHQLQATVEQQKMAHAANLENFKAVIAAGQNTIRTMLLLNGGAAVALLAYIGHLDATGTTVADVPKFAWCLLLFAVGSLCAALVSAATYLSQWLYGYTTKPKLLKAGFIMNLVCIALGLASFVFFGWGMIAAHAAFIR
jgi:hypothetical protein